MNDMTDNDMQQIVAKATRMINYKMHAEQLFVPVLKDLKRRDDGNLQTILLAEGHGFTKQLTSDGFIDEGRFEQRIDLVIDHTKQFMKNKKCDNVDNSFIFHKEYNNGLFTFRIYVCDLIAPVGNERKIIRQFIAYFVEPKQHDFYQLSLSAGPFILPTEQLKPGLIDLNEDKVTIMLDKMMQALMDNLKYKD